MNLYFWSDPHFGHKKINEFCNRPYSSVEEMNEALITNYNQVVGEKDSCIWVGDCFFCKPSKAKEIMTRLNGYKVLVRGNHDFSHQRMLNIGFDSVQDDLWMKASDKAIQIKHYPFKHSNFKHLKMSFANRFLAATNDLRYYSRLPKDFGQFLIHGHTHQTKTFVGRSIHVGVDSNEYKPISMEEITNYIEKYRGK